MDVMAEAGFDSVFTGIATPNAIGLTECCKTQNKNKEPAATTPTDWQRILAFWRACLRLGVFGKERFQYWRLLIWTLVQRPRMMPLAVTLAIYGYHYRKICERYIL